MFCLIFLLGHIVLVTQLMARPSIFVHPYMCSKLLHIISEQPVRYDSRGCVTIVWQVVVVVDDDEDVDDNDDNDEDNDGNDDYHRDNDNA